jgi:tRNA threonylcarbamoyladenosine biosynthesis protein TsaE
MTVVLKSESDKETIELGKTIARYLFKGAVITLNGDLGAGKTTFAKGIAEGLGIKEEVISPTFNILKCYFHEPISLYHIDAYRLENVDESIKNIGLEEVIEGDGVAIIEWGEFIKELLPPSRIDVAIKILGDNLREFTFSSEDEKYKDLLGFLGGYKK